MKCIDRLSRNDIFIFLIANIGRAQLGIYVSAAACYTSLLNISENVSLSMNVRLYAFFSFLFSCLSLLCMRSSAKFNVYVCVCVVTKRTKSAERSLRRLQLCEYQLNLIFTICISFSLIVPANGSTY